MTKKYYAVKKGKQKGVYNSWADCQKQIAGVSGAIFKSFTNYDEARKFADSDPILTYKLALDLDFGDYDIICHSDGGCRNHGNKKGNHVQPNDSSAWACLVENHLTGEKIPLTDGDYGKTNNYMEVLGVMNGLKYLVQHNLLDKKILFVCDSKYALNASDPAWLKDKEKQDFNIPNGDLWAIINNLLKMNFKDVDLTWAWIHGHSGETGNDFVDNLLNKTMNKLDKKRDAHE